MLLYLSKIILYKILKLLIKNHIFNINYNLFINNDYKLRVLAAAKGPIVSCQSFYLRSYLTVLS